MIESQFAECISLFNHSLKSAIEHNNWKINYNNMSFFYGGSYGYVPVTVDSNYLHSCIINTTEKTLNLN